ncbi:hypothetical protein ACBP45_07035 [Latilactobacillus sakei]
MVVKEVRQTQTDIVKALINFLQQSVDFYAGADIGDFRKSGDRIAFDLRATDKRKRYFNGNVRQWFSLKIYAKSTDWNVAVNFLDSVSAAIDNASRGNVVSADNRFNFISAIPTGAAAYTGTMTDDGQNYVIWSMPFELQAQIIK